MKLLCEPISSHISAFPLATKVPQKHEFAEEQKRIADEPAAKQHEMQDETMH